jgi:hypothetical protein
VAELTEAFNGMLEEWEQLRHRELVQREQFAHTEKMAAVGHPGRRSCPRGQQSAGWHSGLH